MTDNITVTLAGSRMNLSSAFGGVTGEGNATRLRLVFDESWDQLTKKVTFFDAAGENPVVRTLTTDLLEAGSTRIYLCPIPPEPLALAGEMSFVVDGWTDGVRARSLEGALNVGYAPKDDTAGLSADPTPTQAEQLQAEIDAIITDIVAGASAVNAKEAAQAAQAGAEAARAVAEQSAQVAAASSSTAAGSASEAVQAKQAILGMGVQGVTLDAGGMVSVEKIVAVDESVTLKFSIPRGDKGDKGDTGATGATGPQGVSIVSVVRTSGTGAPGSTDTYTITLSNGQNSTFQVYNGADGEGVGDMLSSVYDPQGKAQDVFAYAAQKIHAAQHAAGGSDPVTPGSIGAAEVGHTHTPAGIGAAPAGHTHDDRYFTKEEVMTAVTVAGTPEVLKTDLNATVPLIYLAGATDGNGNVVCGGGKNTTDNSFSASVMKITPSGAVIALEDLSLARRNLAAAKDGNGNVLFGGGLNSNQSAVVDKYTSSGTHTTLSSLSVARHQLAAATDGNGNVLFGGGNATYGTMTSPNAAVDRYTPSGTKTTLSSLTEAKVNLAAATDGNGNVLFAGGYGGTSNAVLSSVDKYAPNGTKSTLSALSVARQGLAAATDGNGAVLFAGGQANGSPSYDTVDKYDTAGVRTTLTSLSQVRQNLVGVTDKDGNVLFAGGNTVSSDLGTNIVDKYDTAGVKTTGIALSAGRRAFVGAKNNAGQVIFVGGHNTTSALTIDRLIPANSPKSITIPPYTTYKFIEHSTEQFTTTGSITVETPNTGYFRFGGGNLSY